MTLYERLADLPLVVEDCGFDLREAETSSGFTRTTTVVTLAGDGVRGHGEDVTYESESHYALVDAPPDFGLAGEWTFEEFAARLDGVDLFPNHPPEQALARNYRRFAVESAALDLALRQADTDLASALDRSYDPLHFVASTRLGEPPSPERVHALRDIVPGLEFKLDPTSAWTPELVSDLAATGAVRIVDLKGQYEGTEVDQPADRDLYELVIESFPEAIVEDPELTAETHPLVERHADRLSWDYPITGPESIDAQGLRPAWVNVKPSRFGAVEDLLATVERCERAGIGLYGGGQFELGVGRDHVQAFASALYPEAPNDVAPRAFNRPSPPPDLPASPLAPPERPRGLGWS
ncbi:MAG: hypothetical protein ABEJ68_09980 [Halobacteriaceae archaeon]